MFWICVWFLLEYGFGKELDLDSNFVKLRVFGGGIVDIEGGREGNLVF